MRGILETRQRFHRERAVVWLSPQLRHVHVPRSGRPRVERARTARVSARHARACRRVPDGSPRQRLLGRPRRDRRRTPSRGDSEQRRNQGRRPEGPRHASRPQWPRGSLAAPSFGAQRGQAGGREVHREPQRGHGLPNQAVGRPGRRVRDYQRAHGLYQTLRREVT